jgi:ATP-dependent Clp protease adaptor protein ClpS
VNRQAFFGTNQPVSMPEKKYTPQGTVATKDRVETVEPPLYKVLLHNDDYTSMEFVVSILIGVFHKSLPEATRIMLNVHEQGIGIAGIFTREICETKIERVHSLARQKEFPLRCSMEKA